MDLWLAVKAGVRVRAFFPATKPAAVQGEYLTLLVKDVNGPPGPTATFTGEVLDDAIGVAGVAKGQKVTVKMEAVEEVVG